MTEESAAARPDRADIHAAWIVAFQSVVWTVFSRCAAVAIGLSVGSVLLVAVGAVAFLDALGSAAVAYHLHHGLRHNELADHLEKLAHRLVIVGLLTVGCAAILARGVRLIGGEASDSSPLGIGLAAVSLVVLSVLSRRKYRLADRVASGALRAEGYLSAIVVGAVAVTVGLQSWRNDLRASKLNDPRARSRVRRSACAGVGNLCGAACGRGTWFLRGVTSSCACQRAVLPKRYFRTPLR